MTISTALRMAAVITAGMAIFDPSCTVRGRVPLSLDLRILPDARRAESANASEPAPAATAEEVRGRLARALEGQVDFHSPEPPSAVVLLGDRAAADDVPEGVPVSTVSLSAPVPEQVRIVAAPDPPPALPGWNARITAQVEATNMRGRSSTLVLEHDGVELAATEHHWTHDRERTAVSLEFAPPTPGVHPLRIRVKEGDSPPKGTGALRGLSPSAADVRLVVEERRLRILTYEPRPSWAATFVRRAIESDPLFDVSVLVKTSRAVAVRTGTPPETLSSRALEGFDAVLVGAPDALGAGEVTALEAFARRRGGAVIFLPDRRPSGRYLEMLPAEAFEERVLESPVEISSGAAALKASELAIPRETPAATDVLATVDRAGTERAVVFAARSGAGRVIFSGALDAWRNRVEGDGFTRFWRAQVGSAAAEAPRPVEIMLRPGVAAPGERVTLQVKLRATEFEHGEGVVQMPLLGARLVMPTGGTEQPIRLWPTAEQGTFEGHFDTPPPGQYDVQVLLGTKGRSFDTILISKPTATGPAFPDSEALSLIASGTGGVSVAAADLTALEDHLRALPRPESSSTRHPARSAWWALAFVSLLCAEWTIRRRQGRV